MSLWLPQGDGSYRLAEITADADAVARGGDLLANPVELWGDLIPWSDGSGDRLRWRLILPEGVRVVRVEDGETGWKAFLSNGEEVWMDSLYPTRWLPYLSRFARPGVKSVWWRDVSAIVDNGDGWWQAEQFEMSGMGQHNLCPQGIYTDQEPWVSNSIAIYGAAHKVHNRNGGPTYTSGKEGHWPAPLAIFWNTDGVFIGKVIGRLVIKNGGMLVEKQFPVAAMAAFMQSASKVSTDATLGWTTNGAVAPGSGTMEQAYYRIGFATENGTVDSHSFNFYGSGTTNMMSAIYDGTTYDAENYAPNALLANSDSGSYARPTLDTTKTVTYSGTKPTITSGNHYWIALFSVSDSSANMNARFDDMIDTDAANKDGAGRYIYDGWGQSAGGGITSPPATASYNTHLTTVAGSNYHHRYTAWLTYTATAASGSPGAVFLNNYRRRH